MNEMVVGVGLAVLFVGGLVVPRIIRSIRTKFHQPDTPQKNTLIITLGFWTGAPDENGSGSSLTQTLAASISKCIYNDVFVKVSF